MKQTILFLILGCLLSGAAHAADVPTRKVLLEYFSTQSCSGCPAMTSIWKEIAAETENFIWVTHHAGFTPDIFTILESKEYEWFYEGNPFAPGSMLDRSDMSTYGGAMVSMPADKASFEYMVNRIGRIHPQASVEIARRYDPESRLLEITVSGNGVYSLPENPVLTVYLTENKLIAPQVSTSGTMNEYSHEHVIRYVLSDTWGDEVVFEDNAYSKTYRFTVPEPYFLQDNNGNDVVKVNNVENMEIIAFLSNRDGDDRYNNKVCNAESIALVGNNLPDDAPERKVLLEYFSTQSCGNCPAQSAVWKEVLAENDNLIWITNHAGYGTDVFTIAESTDYLWFYGGSTYAPASMLDRTDTGVYGGGLVFGPKNKSTSAYIVKKLLDAEPAVAIRIEKEYNESTRLLSVKISGEALSELPANPRLTVYLVENGLIEWQYGAEGMIDEYVHDHVLRAVLSDTWGDPCFSIATTLSEEYSFTIPEEWVVGNMEVVAFVSNYDENNRNNCKVLNAQSAKVITGSTAINNPAKEDNILVYSSNGSLIIKGDYLSAEVYDVAGKRIESPTSGVYIVRVYTANGVINRKVMIR